MNTGDIILFSNEGWIGWMIEKLTFSPYSHVAMVVKDPHLLFPEREDMKEKKGIYILESSYEPDTQNFLGVQLYPLQFTNGVKWHRRLRLKQQLDTNTLKATILRVLGLKYNFIDLLQAEFGIKLRRKYDKAFFCSSLMAYLFYHMSYLPLDIDWNNFLPKHFSSSYLNELYNDCGSLDKEEKVL